MRDYREAARLDALHQLKLLDTPPSESFDRITRMAAQIFGLPTAAVSLTDHDRQWFKSRIGVDGVSLPRDQAPCAEVAETTAVLAIEDMAADPCYADSPLARSGTRFYAGAPLVTNDGFGLGALCVLGPEPRQAGEAEMKALTDLAAMVMAQIELQHAFGRIDPVSGMPTRTQFHDDLIDLARDFPGQRRFAVVVDLAREEQVNKMTRVLGGARVDEMVREAANALRGVLRPGQIAYHVAPTQFAFLSPPDVSQEDYVQAVQAGFDKVRGTSSVRFVTAVSIGVRPFELGRVVPDDVLRGATSAVQDARTTDGAIAIYSLTKDREHRRQYGLLGDFGAALEAEDQLRLVYQPRIDLATGRCIGAEALLRWEHPWLGAISPGEFVPLIEQTAIARSMTQWVLDAALDQLACWSAEGRDLVLAINVSAANLIEVDLIERIQLGLLQRRLRPELLEIELTESSIMDQPAQALAMLRELAATGVRLAIDDFGTGQSSLAYLQQVPADVVKIDQAFVRNLVEPEGADFVLAAAMIDLAHKLGFGVVAEGVETQEAAAVLANAGCEAAQGFLFARPMEIASFDTWFARGHGDAARVGVAA